MGKNFKFAAPRDGVIQSEPQYPFLGKVIVTQSGGYEVLNLSNDTSPYIIKMLKELRLINFQLNLINNSDLTPGDVTEVG